MSVVDTAKIIGELVKKGATIDLQEKIIELRQEAIDLQEENLRLKEENRDLKERIELQGTVHFDRRVYWRDGDPVPFCPLCYERDHALMHLNGPSQIKGFAGMMYVCLHCKSGYREAQGGAFYPRSNPLS